MTLCIRRRACSVVVASSGSEEEEEEGEEEKGKGQRTVQRSFHCSVHNDCTCTVVVTSFYKYRVT